MPDVPFDASKMCIYVFILYKVLYIYICYILILSNIYHIHGLMCPIHVGIDRNIKYILQIVLFFIKTFYIFICLSVCMCLVHEGTHKGQKER